ncbi:MAG: GNAT family N-acetyltransferase [Chloroflexota bacterium]|nr:GNAT family N-acetyltransferase [Chloroflexota bacterium]
MLKGEHVVLRPSRNTDFDSWYRLMAEDVEVSLLGSGVWFPYTVEAARKRWEGVLHADPDERLSFAVEVAGEFIGTVTLKDIDRRSQHAWLSIVLDGARVGRGYGRDALHTLLRWAFGIQNFHRISLETWATNERALRCYRAVGFVEEGRMREVMWLDGEYVDAVQMGILRREWQAAR